MTNRLVKHHPLRVYRFQRGITLEQFARTVDATASTLSRIEQRQIKPSMDLAERIALATRGAVMPNDFIDLPPAISKEKKLRKAS